MKKAALITRIAEKSNLTKEEAESALNAFISTVAESLQAGEKLQVPGLGIFELKERAARTGHKPGTGEEIEIAAKRVPAFKPVKAFKDLFNA